MSEKPTMKQIGWLARTVLAASCEEEQTAAFNRLGGGVRAIPLPMRLVFATVVLPRLLVGAIVRHARSVWRNYPIRDH